MPATSIARSILTARRDQVHAMGGSQDLSSEPLQQLVADLLASLNSPDLLSLPWIEKLLHAFLVIHDEFHEILRTNKSMLVSNPHLEKLVTDYLERSVKTLDVLNAVRDGVYLIKQWRNCLDIISASFSSNSRIIGEGQILRAKKALTELTILMINDKDSLPTSAVSARNRSFNRLKNRASDKDCHFRSLSWSVSRNWSAARQLQVISGNLSAPRASDVTSTNGLVIPIYMMNLVSLFVMWALVAAIPCQDRGLGVNFFVSRQFVWSGSLILLHEKIMEESKKRERKNANANGLLREISLVEKCMRNLNGLIDEYELPIREEKEKMIREEVNELNDVRGVFCEGLDMLERMVREVFHKIVRNRTEGFDCLSHGVD